MLKKREGYKPFSFPWAFDAYKRQQQILWIPEEVPLDKDIEDWESVLTEKEKNFLTHIFRFFTQSDIDVANGYIKHHLPTFLSTELRMMLSIFAYVETIHIDSYSLLITAVNMPDEEYTKFLEYKVMCDKHSYLTEFNTSNEREILKTLAVYGAFTEGLQLFASFAMLLNFSRLGKMKGMGQIVTWSIRDESLHVESIIKMFHTLKEQFKGIYDDKLKKEIIEIAKTSVSLEDRFIELAFELGSLDSLREEEVKQYIRFVCNQRLNQLSLLPLFDIKEHPLPWLKSLLNGIEHTNFFENRVTEYSNATTAGNWNEVWKAFNFN